jgi:hypothetical protein
MNKMFYYQRCQSDSTVAPRHPAATLPPPPSSPLATDDADPVVQLVPLIYHKILSAAIRHGQK